MLKLKMRIMKVKNWKARIDDSGNEKLPNYKKLRRYLMNKYKKFK